MYIETQQYGADDQLTFLPHYMLLETGYLMFRSQEEAASMALAKALFDVEGVTAVKIGTDYITVTKVGDRSWQPMSEECRTVIETHLTPLLPKGDQDHSGMYLLAESVLLGGLLLM